MKKTLKQILFLILGMLVIFSLPFRGLSQNINQSIQAAAELEKTGKTEETLKLYEVLYTQYPENSVLYTRFRDFCMRNQKYDRVAELVKDRRLTTPGDPGLDVTEARILFKQGEQERAIRAWKDILDRHPQQILVYQLVAEAMIQERLLEEAVEVYLLARERSGQKDLFALNLINLYTAQIEYGKATRELLLFYETHPEQATLLENQLCRFPKTDRVVQEVTEPLNLAIRKNPSDRKLRRSLVMFYLNAERYDEGLKAALDLEAITPAQKQGEMLYQAAQSVFQAGSSEEAVPIYQALISQYQNFRMKEEACFGLAQCYEILGEVQKAVGYYYQAADSSRNPSLAAQAMFHIGSLYQKQFRLSDAQTIFQDIIDRYPNTPEQVESRFSLSECRIGMGDLEGSGNIIQEVIRSFPEEVRDDDPLWVKAQIRMAEILYLKGVFQESLQLLRETTRTHLKVLSLQEPDLNNGLMLQLFLGEQLKKNPEPLHLLVRGEKWIRMHLWEESIPFFDSLIVEWADQPAAVVGLFRKGEVLIQMKSFSRSLASFDTLIARYPSHLLADRALERTGWICEHLGKKKNSLDRYEQLLIQYPQSFLADEIRGRIRRLETDQS